MTIHDDRMDMLAGQIQSMVHDISHRFSSTMLAGAEYSEDTDRMFVWVMERDAPLTGWNADFDCLIDFHPDLFDAKKVNECIEALAEFVNKLESMK